MKWMWNRRPQPAMVVAVLALVVALGGVAGAQAGLIGPSGIANNAILSRHIAPDAVLTTDIAPSAVLTTDIAPNAVTRSDIKDSTIDTGDLAPGAVRTHDLAGGPSASVTRIGNVDPGGVGSVMPCAFFVPTWTTTEGWDSSSLLHPSGTTLVVPEDGVYEVQLTLPWDNVSGGWRSVGVQVDPAVGPNVDIGPVTSNQTADGVVMNVSGTFSGHAGDVIAAGVFSCQHSAPVGFSTTERARLSVDWVRPLVG